VTSMMTPPLSISARPDFTVKVPVSRCIGGSPFVPDVEAAFYRRDLRRSASATSPGGA
jgi:hypothetical protein